MRKMMRFGKGGFTLVELMIVVAIIGVLAALAIYGVRKYLASAKTSEAKNTIGAIARGAAAAYERETTASQLVTEGSASTGANHALCNSSTSVPNNISSVKGTKYQPNTANNADFETGDALNGWRCLKFSLSQPIYYRYTYLFGNSTVPGAPTVTANGFSAEAIGDLDNDGQNSGFARVGTVNPTTAQLKMATQVHVSQEFE
jgi:type IV pilus assembly protein PilA